MCFRFRTSKDKKVCHPDPDFSLSEGSISIYMKSTVYHRPSNKHASRHLQWQIFLGNCYIAEHFPQNNVNSE